MKLQSPSFLLIINFEIRKKENINTLRKLTHNKKKNKYRNMRFENGNFDIISYLLFYEHKG